MTRACPACPDGNEWNSNGPTGRACRTCGGKAWIPQEGECPSCGADLIPRHHEGDMLAPEADWTECSECDYRTEPE